MTRTGKWSLGVNKSHGFISQMAVAEKRLFSSSVSSHDISTYVQKLRFSAPLPGLGLASMKHVVRLNHPHTDRCWLLVLISSGYDD